MLNTKVQHCVGDTKSTQWGREGGKKAKVKVGGREGEGEKAKVKV
jgi:hypothetical protein